MRVGEYRHAWGVWKHRGGRDKRSTRDASCWSLGRWAVGLLPSYDQPMHAMQAEVLQEVCAEWRASSHDSTNLGRRPRRRRQEARRRAAELGRHFSGPSMRTCLKIWR